jgi:hypothetical protein
VLSLEVAAALASNTATAIAFKARESRLRTSPRWFCDHVEQPALKLARPPDGAFDRLSKGWGKGLGSRSGVGGGARWDLTRSQRCPPKAL